MADFILARKSRNIASSMVHVLLNLLLGVMAVLVTVLSGSPTIGILLVMASKWRVFAVRPRYFFVSLKSNLVDMIVGLAVVILAYHAGTSIAVVHFGLAGFYVIWLLFIKPLSSERAALYQSIIAVFMGSTAAVIMTANWDAIVLTVLVFLTAYSASRHALVQGSEEDFTLTTLVAGLVCAEIAWLGNFWMIIYTFGNTGIRIPQLAIILTIFAFVFNYVRQTALKYERKFRFKDVAMPIIFGVVLISIIFLWFSNPIFNI